jgi:hypothetical protein
MSKILQLALVLGVVVSAISIGGCYVRASGPAVRSPAVVVRPAARPRTVYVQPARPATVVVRPPRPATVVVRPR